MFTRTVNGSKYNVHTNGQWRDTFDVYFDDYDGWKRLDDAYHGSATISAGFEYRGSIYALADFEVAPDDVKALGFDGIQTESYFSAVVVTWFDVDGNYIDDGVKVAYIHW